MRTARTLGLLALAALLAVPISGASRQRASLSVRPFLTGLDQPVYLAATKSQPNTVYVVEQGGKIRVATRGKLRAQPFLDLTGRIASGGEQGLLSVAFHARYAKNHKLYVDYTDRSGDTRVVELRSRNGVAAKSGRQLLFVDQPYANHNGGQLQFGPDGWLYVGMGDGGAGGDPGNRAQNLGSRLGKLLRINVNTRRPVVQVVGYGLRNPWRFTFDRRGGDLYIGDVGQNAWEEIDYTPRSSPGLENYGWRVYEGNHVYQQGQQPSGPGKLVQPIAEYPHAQGCSVTGGYVYRGSSVAAAQGRYFYGDYCSGRIWSLRVTGGRATDLRQESFRVPNLTSFGEDARGELYAVSSSGTVSKLAP
jgi:glucose/arabinose dehydrogenase